MRSIFRWQGGKGRPNVRDLILSYFPKSFEEYREPFVGGGGLFFGIDRSVPRRWINDLNPGLIAVYEVLWDRPDEFIRLCRAIPTVQVGEETFLTRRGKPLNLRLGKLFKKFLADPTADLALAFFFINRTSFGGRTFKPTYTAPERWSIVYTDVLERAAAYIWGTRITRGDYEPLLMTPGERVHVYADPPYFCETEMPRNGKLYEFGFKGEDHFRFSNLVHQCPHRICISYDDHPMVRKLYDDMNIHEASWPYCGSSRKKKRDGRELIITNYPDSEMAGPNVAGIGN